MNPTVALPGSMIWMGIRLSSGSRPQSPKGPSNCTYSIGLGKRTEYGWSSLLLPNGCGVPRWCERDSQHNTPVLSPTISDYPRVARHPGPRNAVPLCHPEPARILGGVRDLLPTAFSFLFPAYVLLLTLRIAP